MKTLTPWSKSRLVAAACVTTVIGAITLVPWHVVAQQTPTRPPDTDAMAEKSRPDLVSTLAFTQSPDAAAPSAPATDPNEPTIRLNFRNAPAPQVFNALSEKFGITIITPAIAGTTTITGNISVTSGDRAVTLDEAIPLVNDAVRPQGFTLDQSSAPGARLKVFRALPIAQAQGIAPVAQAEPPLTRPRPNRTFDKTNAPLFTGDATKIEPSDKVVNVIIPLKNADAANVRRVLSSLLSPDAIIVPDTQSNSILLTDTSAQVRRIAEIIQALDTNAAGRPASGRNSPGPDPRVASEPKLPQARPAPQAEPKFNYAAAISAPIIELRAPMEGTLNGAPEPGAQTVKKGAILFNFDSRDQKLKIAVGEARVRLAESKYAAAREKASQTETEMRQYVIEIEAEKVIFDSDRQKLADLEVRAAFDGTFTALDFAPGQFIAKGALLGTLVNTSEVRVDFLVPARDLAHTRVGQKLSFTPDIRNAAAVPGEIAYIAPTVDAASQTISVRGRFTAPSGAQPQVQIQGGGTGATATANTDAKGNITGITITNPGTGYTSAPNFALVGGTANLKPGMIGRVTLSEQ